MIKRIILHGGTPKTGTTALQISLESARDDLSRRGFFYPATVATLYPKRNGTNGVKRKHQWLVNDLIAPDSAGLLPHLDRVSEQAPANAHTAILSTEGIFHHWWDFSEAGYAALAELAWRFEVELWVWFREPQEFFTSSYIQMLKNPRAYVACYGRDWSPDRILDDPWFARQLDYAGFVQHATHLLGAKAVRPFLYRGSTVRDFFEALGCQGLGANEPFEHASPSALGVKMLRVINRWTVRSGIRRRLLRVIHAVDGAFGNWSVPYVISRTASERVASLSAGSVDFLRRTYGLDLSRSI